MTTNTVTVSGTATDYIGLSRVEVSVNSGSWQLVSGTNSWSTTVTLSQGSNTIHARATDNSGKITEKSVDVISDIPPTISISSPSSGDTLTTNTVTVSGTATDDIGLSRVEVSVNSGSWQLVSGTNSWSTTVTLSQGSNTIHARATDNSGKITEKSVDVISDIPPTISISSPSSGDTLTTNTVTVSGTATDDIGLSRVEVSVNSGSWQLASGTNSWSTTVTLSQGSNTIYARATDIAGNTAETLVSPDFIVPFNWGMILGILSVIGGVLGLVYLYPKFLKPLWEPPPNIAKQLPIIVETRGGVEGIEGIGPKMHNSGIKVEVRSGVERL